MRVVIAGGHGKIALRLARLLCARGDQAVGLVRNPEHFADVAEAGAQPVVADLPSARPRTRCASAGRTPRSCGRAG